MYGEYFCKFNPIDIMDEIQQYVGRQERFLLVSRNGNVIPLDTNTTSYSFYGTPEIIRSIVHDFPSMYQLMESLREDVYDKCMTFLMAIHRGEATTFMEHMGQYVGAYIAELDQACNQISTIPININSVISNVLLRFDNSHFNLHPLFNMSGKNRAFFGTVHLKEETKEIKHRISKSVDNMKDTGVGAIYVTMDQTEQLMLLRMADTDAIDRIEINTREEEQEKLDHIVSLMKA